MAERLCCCLNLPLPNPNSSQSSKPFFRKRREEEMKPRNTRTCSLVGFAACVVIGAAELCHVSDSAAAAAVVESPVTARRWSEKRTCPPWLHNSLETIVPENLPRPSTRRSWESIGLRVGHAPLVGAVVTRGNNRADCFSM